MAWRRLRPDAARALPVESGDATLARLGRVRAYPARAIERLEPLVSPSEWFELPAELKLAGGRRRDRAFQRADELEEVCLGVLLLKVVSERASLTRGFYRPPKARYFDAGPVRKR